MEYKRGSSIVKCDICGKERRQVNAEIRRYKNHYCSLECKRKAQLGKEPINKGKKGLQIAWNKGKKCPQLSGENNPRAMLGKTAWNKGIKGSIKPNRTSFKKGQIPWIKGKKGVKYWLGKKRSEETIKKIRDARAKQIIPLQDTSIEIKIQNFLKGLNIEYYPHQYIKIEHSYLCDILVPSLSLVIECDGDYFHNYPFGNDIDHIRTKEMKAVGFNVLRLWERDIKKMDIETFKEKLQSYKLQEGTLNIE
jgi:very-short-patch-repair endonuclease